MLPHRRPSPRQQPRRVVVTRQRRAASRGHEAGAGATGGAGIARPAGPARRAPELRARGTHGADGEWLNGEGEDESS